jgi:hypothetical protein
MTMQSGGIMKIMLIAAAAAGMTLSQSASAEQPRRGGTLFACALPGGKTVKVTARGDRITYRFGTPRRAELMIVGSAANRNMFATTRLHGGPTYWTQLRFVRGEYSYVVHSVPRSRTLDNVASSGLMVFRGGRLISDRACRRWTELSFDALAEIPEDREGAPSAFD